MNDTERLIRAYYAAFNNGDLDDFFALLTEDVVHDINQGEREIGKAAFRAFLQRMNRCYQEHVSDVVIMVDASGERAAAEFTVSGNHQATDEGLPPARGQVYQLPAGAFSRSRWARPTSLTIRRCWSAIFQGGALTR